MFVDEIENAVITDDLQTTADNYLERASTTGCQVSQLCLSGLTRSDQTVTVDDPPFDLVAMTVATL
jgi:hypothetical protein